MVKKNTLKSFTSKKPSLESLNISSKQINISLQVSAVIKFLLFLAFFTYVVKLDKTGCKCSNDWEKEYIKYYSLAVLVIALIEFFFQKDYLKFYIIHTIMGVGGLVFIFTAVKYIHDLKKKECSCSRDWRRTTLDIYAWLCIIILILSFLALIFSIHKTKK
jgi:hypothetical protein